MSENLNHFDEYFKKHLKELESETSDDRWKKLYWKLFLKKWSIWIIAAVFTALLISGWILVYHPTTSIALSEKSVKQFESNKPVLLNTGVDSILSDNYKPEKNNQADNTTLTDSKNEIPNEISNADNGNTGITSASYDDGITSNKAVAIEDNLIPAQSSITQIPMIPIIKPEEIVLDDNTFEISRIEMMTDSTKDTTNKRSTNNLLRKGFSVGMYLLPVYITKSLKAEETYSEYLDIRSESEENVLLMGLGVEFKQSLNKIYLQSGLEYSVYGENVRYNYTTNTVDLQNSYYSYDTTWVWIYDPPVYGEPHPIAIDSSWNAVYEKIEMTSIVKNRFQFIEIPLIAGFQTNKRKLNFEIGTGISFGWLISCKGNLPDISLNSLSELGKSTPFLQKTTFNYILNAGIEYNLNETWSIILKPNYKQNLLSFFTKDYDISQKYHTFGVIMGIRIKL
jgi:hypothetical protein